MVTLVLVFGPTVWRDTVEKFCRRVAGEESYLFSKGKETEGMGKRLK